MYRRFVHRRLLLAFALSALVALTLGVGLYALAWMAITDGHLPADFREVSLGTRGQNALTSDCDSKGHAVMAGPDAAASMFEGNRSATSMRGHNAPLITARLVQRGNSLITVDAGGDARITDVKKASWIGRAEAILGFGRLRKNLWTFYGRPLAQLSLAVLAPLYPISFNDCDGCPEMVVVPTGRFLMGSPESEAGRTDAEGPQHEVRIARPFAVGKFVVKRAEYASFVAATGYPDTACGETSNGDSKSQRSWRNPGYGQAESHPVVCVSWEDAKAYAAWLSVKTGYRYRLLIEAEWEYAARAGTRTPFWWGSSISEHQANYGNFRKTLPVDTFQPNRFGLYQVHGNVWEWVVRIAGTARTRAHQQMAPMGSPKLLPCYSRWILVQ